MEATSRTESKLPVLWGVYVKARSREHAEAIHQDISTYLQYVLGVRPMIVIMRSLPPEIEAQRVPEMESQPNDAASLAAHGPDGGHDVIAQEIQNQSCPWMPWQPTDSDPGSEAATAVPPHVCPPIRISPISWRQRILIAMLWLTVIALVFFLLDCWRAVWTQS